MQQPLPPVSKASGVFLGAGNLRLRAFDTRAPQHLVEQSANDKVVAVPVEGSRQGVSDGDAEEEMMIVGLVEKQRSMCGVHSRLETPPRLTDMKGTSRSIVAHQNGIHPSSPVSGSPHLLGPQGSFVAPPRRLHDSQEAAHKQTHFDWLISCGTETVHS